jgi:hypothetical protein
MWNSRIGAHVRLAAEGWLWADTKVRQKEIFDEHGVQWSSIHRLHYRDPVQHTVLGMMHNWIEEILQHHTHVKWGIGIVLAKSRDDLAADDADNIAPTTPTGNDLDIDIDMLYDELDDLNAESQEHADTPSHGKRLHSETSLQLPDDENDDSPLDKEFQPDSDSDSDDGYASEDKEHEAAWQAVCIFGPEALSKIHACIADTKIPTWIAHPPRNLGEKSHGKLKADQWLTLFTIFLPLILPKIWLSSRKTHDATLLDNFHDLVKCTSIVCSYTASPVLQEPISGSLNKAELSLCYAQCRAYKILGPFTDDK